MNKYLTKTLAVVTLCGVMITPVMPNVSAQEIEKNSTYLDTTYVMNEMMTFEDYSKDFRKDLTENQIIEAKELFEEAVKYDDKANEAWDKLFYMDIYDNNYVVAECKEYNFEDFSKDLIKEATETEKAEAKKLFEEAIELEKDGEYDKAKKVWEKLYDMDIYNYENIDSEIVEYIDNYTIEDFSKELKDDITKEQKEEAKELFEKAIKLEEDEKYEEAMKVWDELYKKDIFKYDNIIIDDVDIVNYVDYSFEDFSKEFKKDITKEQKEEAEKLFEKAIKLEEDEKYEEAIKIWEKLYSLDIFDYSIEDIDFGINISED